MKFLKYLAIVLFTTTGCEGHKIFDFEPQQICDFETQQCHTKAEWDDISRKNWKLVRCLQSQSDKKVPLEKAYKKCGVTSYTEVDL